MLSLWSAQFWQLKFFVKITFLWSLVICKFRDSNMFRNNFSILNARVWNRYGLSCTIKSKRLSRYLNIICFVYACAIFHKCAVHWIMVGNYETGYTWLFEGLPLVLWWGCEGPIEGPFKVGPFLPSYILENKPEIWGNHRSVAIVSF